MPASPTVFMLLYHEEGVLLKPFERQMDACCEEFTRGSLSIGRCGIIVLG